MERLIRFFVERHLLVNVVTLAVVVLGLLAILRTNVEGFPEASLPFFMVTASLPGASARARSCLPVTKPARRSSVHS